MIPPMILDAVKKELKRREWSNYKLAEAVKARGGTPDPIYRFLSGERQPTVKTLELICDILELELKPVKKV